MIKVVLFDDEPVILDGLRLRLSSHDDIRIMGEATATADMLQLVELHQPDVLVMDVHLVDAEVEATMRSVLAKVRPPVILVFSADGRVEAIRQSLRMGACGYLLRCEDTSTSLAQAVRSVAKGIPWPSPEVTRRLEKDESDPGSAEPVLTFADAGLSECELKVLRCLAQDMSNAKIAESLRVTENTVRYHLKNIYSKLGVATRVGAAVWAVKHLPPFVED